MHPCEAYAALPTRKAAHGGHVTALAYLSAMLG